MLKFVKILFEELFLVGLIGLIFFIFLEIIWPNSVLAYLNISLYLFIWLIIGIINVIYIKANGK